MCNEIEDTEILLIVLSRAYSTFENHSFKKISQN